MNKHASMAMVGLLCLVAASAAGSTPTPGLPTPSKFKDARAYVDAHNAIRAAVEKPNGYAGEWAPLAHLTWSDELATGAQAWADHLRETKKCGLMHSDTRLGENLAGGKGVDARRAVQIWASESGKFRWVPVYEFDRSSGHYSQLVWRKTTQVGCGRATCGSKAVVVCRYNPPGNHIGRAPY